MNSALLAARDTAPGWYDPLSKAIHAREMFDLGVLLTLHDPEAACRWYERAAGAGHVAAMVNLGVLLANDDPSSARAWFERAARAGSAEASLNLDVLTRPSLRATSESTGNPRARRADAKRRLDGVIDAVPEGGPA